MNDQQIYDCIIIGAGPAGLSAALYAARACLNIAIIEKEYVGGKLNKTISIDNYPGYLNEDGYQLGQQMFSQIKNMNVPEFRGDVIKLEQIEGIWNIHTKNKKTFYSKTILIASGMKERVLDIPNIHEYYGKGVSYCAICDGNFYKDKEVVVVGGGNSAVEEAIYLSNLASKVRLVHRRTKWKAEEMSIRKMLKIPNIEINVPYFPIEVTVKDGKVVGLTVENSETGERKLISGECVFFYVGLVPENYFLNNLEIELSDSGFIKTNDNMQTSIPTIFAAGDIIHKHLRQVVTATNDGCIAALSIKSYLDSLSE